MSQVPQPKSVLLVRKSTPVVDDTLARQLIALLDVAEKDANKNGRDSLMKVLGIEGGDVVVFDVEVRRPNAYRPKSEAVAARIRRQFYELLKRKVRRGLPTDNCA